jgi:ferritin
MLKKKMQDAFNKQINAELYSAYMYLSMAAYFASINMPGMANWMRVQVQEETFHGLKMFDFVHERGGRALLKAVDGPPTQWKSPLDAFENVCKHEAKVTGLINALVDLAIAESDHASNNFLQWFVAEQVEEEASADAVVRQLKLAGDNGGALFMLDREMALRVYTPPVTGNAGAAA